MVTQYLNTKPSTLISLIGIDLIIHRN